jgi:hypothetical protein
VVTFRLGTAVRWTAIASHLLLAALLAVAVSQWWKIPAQLSSGYVPDDYWLFVAAVGIPVLLAAFVLAALVRWTRGRPWLLIAVDLVVTVAAWPVLILIVVAADLPLGLLLVAPLGLVLAVVAPTERTTST